MNPDNKKQFDMSEKLPKETEERIKAEVEKFSPMPKRKKNCSDNEWDRIVTAAGTERMCYEMGRTSEALRSLSIEQERDELKEQIKLSDEENEHNIKRALEIASERDRYKEGLEKIASKDPKHLVSASDDVIDGCYLCIAHKALTNPETQNKAS